MSTNSHVEMATTVLAATEAAKTALEAIDTALITAGRLGVACFGWAELTACRHPLGILTNEHGPAINLSRNELAANQ